VTEQSENGSKPHRPPEVLPRGRPVRIPEAPASPRYAITDLEAATGFNPRTIRFYISEGMLGAAQGRGPSATYSKDHLLRLRYIKELKEQHLPLEEIKSRLTGLSTNDLEAHFAIRGAPSEGRWRRIVFRDDLELHVREREPRDYQFERAIDIIAKYARFVLDNPDDLP
jgi:DNA-binding transcriptional MerR regulator